MSIFTGQHTIFTITTVPTYFLSHLLTPSDNCFLEIYHAKIFAVELYN